MTIKFKGLDNDFKAQLFKMQIGMLDEERKSKYWV